MNRSLPFALSLVFIVLVGCGSSSESSRGSLSDAMRASSDKNRGSRKVDAPPPEPRYRTEEERAPAPSPADVPPPPPSQLRSVTDAGDSALIPVPADSLVEPVPTAHRPHIGIGLGSGMLSSGDLFGMSEFFLSWSPGSEGDVAFSGYIAFQDVPLQKTSALNASLDGGLFLAGIGGDIRWYRTPHYTFVGHYLSAGLAFYGLFWEYKNEIELPTYDSEGNFRGYERVKHDVLGAIDLHGGIGLDLGQVWHVQLEGELSPGLVLELGRTLRGCDNDVFKPFLYLKARVAVRFASPF